MLATRFSQPPVAEPAYDMRAVPRARRGLTGSVVQRIVDNRETWSQMQAEILLLCNEAKERRRRAFPADLGCAHSSKPLAMEYIADRIDTDDPIWGFAVRHQQSGALQGFVSMTTFTTWHHSFRWDSLCLEAGTRDTDGAAEEKQQQQQQQLGDCAGDGGVVGDIGTSMTPEEAAVAEWHRTRKLDEDGSLSRELEAELRHGDPAAAGGGTVWPHVAELSLIGALGCGRFLLQLVIDYLENPTEEHGYRFIVLQATEVSLDNGLALPHNCACQLGVYKLSSFVGRHDRSH